MNMRRKKHSRVKNSETNYNVDLAPLLGLMVTLVPLILLSTAFVQIKTFKTEIPNLSKKAIESIENLPKVKEPPHVVSKLSESKSISVFVKSQKEQIAHFKIESIDGTADYKSYQAYLLKIKEQYPKADRIIVETAQETDYEDLLKLIDFSQIRINTDSKQTPKPLFQNIGLGGIVNLGASS